MSTVVQSHKACEKAFLLYPCYRALAEFKAPYGVSSPAGEYEVDARSACRNASPSSWPIDADIHAGQTVRALSLGLFNGLRAQFVVRYRDNAHGSPAAPQTHESVIVGTATLGDPSEVARWRTGSNGNRRPRSNASSMARDLNAEAAYFLSARIVTSSCTEREL